MSDQHPPWRPLPYGSFGYIDHDAGAQDDSENYRVHSPQMHEPAYWQVPYPAERMPISAGLASQTDQTLAYDPNLDQRPSEEAYIWQHAHHAGQEPFQRALQDASHGDVCFDDYHGTHAYSQYTPSGMAISSTHGYSREDQVGGDDRGRARSNEVESDRDSTDVRVGSWPQDSWEDSHEMHREERPVISSSGSTDGHQSKSRRKARSSKKDHSKVAKNNIKTFHQQFDDNRKGDRGGSSASGRRGGK